MLRRSAAVLVSVVLLSTGWLSLTGIPLLAAFVPLLWISASYDASRRSWWRVFGWAALTFVLWNAATVWWIWYATPVGPVAATLASTFLNMIAFMLFHTVSKKGPKPLAYTLLVAAWIATENWYTVGQFSWPWLILGNGFSHEVWAVQWYEYTGVFGGSLWVLLSNILIFEAWRTRSRRKTIAAACAVLLPVALSLGIFWSWKQPDEGTAEVSLIQPNVDCYDKFHGDTGRQERNLIDLLHEVPPEAQFIVLPETSIPDYYWEQEIDRASFLRELADTLRSMRRPGTPGAVLIAGGNTMRYYPGVPQTETARPDRFGGGYYDIFNTALMIVPSAPADTLSGGGAPIVRGLHHKGKLVIGVENTPTWVFRALKFLVIDLGGTLGQIGKGQTTQPFAAEAGTAGAAICYEGLYGDFFGGFVRNGAQFMTIISNDGWWGDTPGYKHLFTISRLRAIEHRRAIARSANTGRSGFISARGDVGETLEWEQRGVITAAVPLNSHITFYTRYGDYLGRIAEYLTGLCILYYIAYRAKKKNLLVK